MKKTIVSIGGGEIKNKTTLEIDRYIAEAAKERAGDRRANALFIGTASHDFMPYFNSFRKTYTSVLGLKVDVALTVHVKTEFSRLQEKFSLADMIYVGGGDTVFMLESWRQTGLLELILDAYNRGVIICGLSAGAICWFEKMYTDSDSSSSSAYSVYKGLGVLDGFASPHYNERVDDFDRTLLEGKNSAIGIEDDCAVVFKDGKIAGVVSAGGKAYYINAERGVLEKREILYEEKDIDV